MEELKQYLQSNDISPSYHRIKILEFLKNNRIHPNVDVIYRALGETIPTLSKTTVYNTLNLFAEKGLVTPLTIEENEARYDIDTSPHGHFKCRECGKVYDVDVSPALDALRQIGEHIITEYQINMKGICNSCNEASKKN